MNLMNLMMGNQLGGNAFAAPSTYQYTPPSSNPFAVAPISYSSPPVNYSSSPPFVSSAPSNANTVHYFDSVASLFSQIFSAWGKTPTTQITPGAGPGGTISYLPNPIVQVAQANAVTAQAYANQSAAGVNNRTNTATTPGLGTFMDQMIQTLTDNPMVLLLGAVGVYLLFREPPATKRR